MNGSSAAEILDWSLEDLAIPVSSDHFLTPALLCLAFLITGVFVYFLAVYFKLYPRCNELSIASGERILFVTAHPDDECMFFGPSIVSITETDPAKVYLLCLSSGNYRHDGHIRCDELLQSCERLGIPISNVLLINSSFFPDGPTTIWDRERLAYLILYHIETLDVDRVVTFDEDGVSGHTNHIAIYNAVLRLTSGRQLPRNCRAYALDTVNVFRKYSSLCDSLLAVLFDDNLYITSFSVRAKVVRAMKAHLSQLVWFRRLYLIFSRYIFINGFTEITDEFNFDLE